MLISKHLPISAYEILRANKVDKNRSIRYVALQQQHFKMKIQTFKLVRWRSKPKIMSLPKNTINFVFTKDRSMYYPYEGRKKVISFLYIYFFLRNTTIPILF